VGDPPGFRLEDCATQRNLSEAGRAQARRLGEAFRARAVPVGEVLSSPWCRCLETGRLAFGRAEPWSALDSQFQDQSRATEQARAVRERAGRRPVSGNLVMISHGANIVAWTGVYPAQGEMVIVTPREDGAFVVAGKLSVE
jgi:broad specificity phosphatase PhoE